MKIPSGPRRSGCYGKRAVPNVSSVRYMPSSMADPIRASASHVWCLAVMDVYLCFQFTAYADVWDSAGPPFQRPAQGVQPVKALAHVAGCQAKLHPHAGRQMDHDCKTSRTVRNVAASTPTPHFCGAVGAHQGTGLAYGGR